MPIFSLIDEIYSFFSSIKKYSLIYHFGYVIFNYLGCSIFALVTGCKNVQLCGSRWQRTLVDVNSPKIYIDTTRPSATLIKPNIH